MYAPLLIAATLTLGAPPEPTARRVEFFEKRVRPVLEGMCISCHRAGSAKGGLELDSKAGFLAGGKHGKVVVPGKPEASRLIRAVRRTDAKLKMPPDDPLDAEEVADLTRWVRDGAVWPGPVAVTKADPRDHWAYKPLRNVRPPKVGDPAWNTSAIDRFVKSALDARGLEPVGLADKTTLLRRVTFDLTGLPPTPEEVDAFLADDSPGAYERVVDRLLASPHYGERWGRHWLDVVRYADTAGDNSDFPVPEAWRYRNYVIDAFNADMPYDQFVHEQIAGDLMPARDWPERTRRLIATGYIAQSRRFGSLFLDYPQHLTIEDTIDNLGKAFLGLTISCARCHDHKFDPISQKDYYALYGIFASTRYSFPGVELAQVPRDWVPLIPPEEVDRLEATFRARAKPIRKEVAKKLKKYRDFQAKVKAAPPEQKEVLERREWELNVETRKSIRKIEQLMLTEIPPYPRTYGAVDGDVGDAHIHVKGNPEELGEAVPRGFLSALGGQRLTAEEAKQSGRLQLARWLTAHPLTARVMVNRVWQHHFGKGIVATPNGFGVRGRPPTHPELLEYLTRRFVAGGWSVKALHREILLSRAYRLASTGGTEKHLREDPGNAFLWRQDRRRLDAESLRDTLLLLGGRLDLSPMNRPHPFPPMSKWKFSQHHPFKEEYPSKRRSIYMMTKRFKRLAYFATFDGADRNTSSPERTQSVTAAQALYLLNNEDFHACADDFARGLLRVGATDEERIDRAYLLAFGRRAGDEERGQALAYLRQADEVLAECGKEGAERRQEAWASLARALLRSNAFLYVD
jgi:hypothetical protein